MKNDQKNSLAIIGNDAGGNEFFQQVNTGYKDFDKKIGELVTVDPKTDRSVKLAMRFRNAYPGIITNSYANFFSDVKEDIINRSDHILMSVDNLPTVAEGILEQKPLTFQIMASLPTSDTGTILGGFQGTLATGDNQSRLQTMALLSYFNSLANNTSSREFTSTSPTAQAMLLEQRKIASVRSLNHIRLFEGNDQDSLQDYPINMVFFSFVLPLVVSLTKSEKISLLRQEALDFSHRPGIFGPGGQAMIALINPEKNILSFIRTQKTRSDHRITLGLSTVRGDIIKKVEEKEKEKQLMHFTD